MLPNRKIAIAMAVCLVILVGCGIAASGEQGPPGVGIDYIVNNGDGTFTLFLTDGSSHTTDNFTGPQGPQGDPGPQGPQGETGPAGPGFDELVSATGVGGLIMSTSWVDLDDGPSVTVNITSGKALVILTVRINIPYYGSGGGMGFAVSGASTIAPSYSQCLFVDGAEYTSVRASATYVVTGLNNGSNTFTVNYVSSGGTGGTAFNIPSIIVVPLP